MKYHRNAVTFIEVVFAIGVILVGLVGLLSILPLAGRRAQESISLATASEFGDAVMNELLTRKYLSNGVSLQGARLGRVLKRLDNTTDREHLLTINSSNNRLELVNLRPVPLGDPVPANIPVVSFCIDPIYVATNSAPQIEPGTPDNYSDEFFPYFQEQDDPMLNPSGALTAWPTVQPRLHRVGFLRSNPTVMPPLQPLSVEQARTIVENPDNLVQERPEDRTQTAFLTALKSGTNLGYGRRVPSGEYSWIATVSPLSNGNGVSVSVVVIRLRDYEQDYQVPPPSTPPTDPRKNSFNERLAYVCAANGFRGGAGGSIRLAATRTVLDSVVSGDWLMLSRRVSLAPTVVDVHRWFRVVSKLPKSLKSETDGTIGVNDTVLNCRIPTAVGTSVWSQELYLVGPDWDFGFALGADDSFGDNTYATLIDGAVSVTERIVRIEEL